MVSLFIGFWFCLPNPLFDDPTSTVIEDRNGRLLGAKIADDGQWRFPYNEQVSDKFKTSIIAFEDRYFLSHPGVNLFSLFRATLQNIKAGESEDLAMPQVLAFILEKIWGHLGMVALLLQMMMC